MTITKNTLVAPVRATVTIDTDLSDKQNHFVSLDGTDQKVVNLIEDATAPAFILCDDGNGSTEAIEGSIYISGIATVKLGGTVTAWDKLTATTGWVAITTTTDTNNYSAIAFESWVSWDIIEVIVERGMIAG